MANAIFILIGPGMRNHKSILEQLAYVDKIKIPSTADAKGPHGSALIATQATPYMNDLTGQSGWIISAVPFGHESLRSGRILSLLDWWNEGVLKGGGGTEVLTRLQVIRVMLDQDGGAHLDDHINDDTYIAVHLRGVGIQYKPSADSEEAIPVDGALEHLPKRLNRGIPMRERIGFKACAGVEASMDGETVFGGSAWARCWCGARWRYHPGNCGATWSEYQLCRALP
jgi:hypothetical protein